MAKPENQVYKALEFLHLGGTLFFGGLQTDCATKSSHLISFKQGKLRTFLNNSINQFSDNNK